MKYDIAKIKYQNMKCFRCSKKQYDFICNFCFHQYSITKQKEKATISKKKRFLEGDFQKKLKNYQKEIIFIVNSNQNIVNDVKKEFIHNQLGVKLKIEKNKEQQNQYLNDQIKQKIKQIKYMQSLRELMREQYRRLIKKYSQVNQVNICLGQEVKCILIQSLEKINYYRNLQKSQFNQNKSFAILVLNDSNKYFFNLYTLNNLKKYFYISVLYKKLTKNQKQRIEKSFYYLSQVINLKETQKQINQYNQRNEQKSSTQNYISEEVKFIDSSSSDDSSMQENHDQYELL